MDVWKLGTDANKDLVIRTAINYFQTHFITLPMSGDWEPPPIRIDGKSKRVRDFVSWMASAPVLSEKAVSALKPLISSHCEILPLIELKKKRYFAINVLTTVDCLDISGSDVLYSPSFPSRILSISRYKFFDDRVPVDIPIFKLPQDVGCAFVTRPFVDAVIANGLRGAAFLDPAANQFGKIARGEPLNVVPGLPE